MKPNYVLRIDDDGEGKAELLRDGDTLWSSDSDPDVLEMFGGDAFTDEDGDELVEYLVDCGVLTWSQADQVEIDSPAESPRGPDDDDDDDDEDDDDGESYSMQVEEERRL